jgi:hypothetical protein
LIGEWFNFFMYKLSTISYKNVRVVRDLGVSVDLLDSLYFLQIAVHVLPIFPFFFFSFFFWVYLAACNTRTCHNKALLILEK